MSRLIGSQLSVLFNRGEGCGWVSIDWLTRGGEVWEEGGFKVDITIA